jgi:hypothetical protein
MAWEKEGRGRLTSTARRAEADRKRPRGSRSGGAGRRSKPPEARPQPGPVRVLMKDGEPTHDDV